MFLFLLKPIMQICFKFRFSVTFLLPSPDKVEDENSEESQSKLNQQTNSRTFKTTTKTTTTKRSTFHHFNLEHKHLTKNSGGRYSILNRDFSLKENKSNFSTKDAKKSNFSMSSPLVVETSGHDQVDFQRTSSHFGNELLKEADSSDLNGKLF